MTTEEKKERRERIDTYTETACGCFTTLQKQAAFMAASSHLVAAADPLGFFGRPPKRVGAAGRFCALPCVVGPPDGPAPWGSVAGWQRGMGSASSSLG